MSRDFVMLAEQRQAEADLKERFEKLSVELKEERERSDQLLYQMLPRNVANSLRQGKTVDASSYDKVTILFSDIVGFTEIAATRTPLEVCSMLNDLYTRFDAGLTAYPDIYKVRGTLPWLPHPHQLILVLSGLRIAMHLLCLLVPFVLSQLLTLPL